MGTIIPLLTEFEKEHISERQALPEKYLGLSDAEMEIRIQAAKETLGDILPVFAKCKLKGVNASWLRDRKTARHQRQYQIESVKGQLHGRNSAD